MSGDKTTAKYAAKLQKPDGLTLIPPWQARERLRNVPVTGLGGINQGIGAFLADRGVFTCGDMDRIPISTLGQRFGNPGRRIWYMCRGEDPDKVQGHFHPPKSVGHGKVMPPDTRDNDLIFMHALHLNRALDLINERFGEFTIAPAKLLHRSDMPNVIAPAWKPYGHRQTIPSTRPQRRRDTSGKVHDMDW